MLCSTHTSIIINSLLHGIESNIIALVCGCITLAFGSGNTIHTLVQYFSILPSIPCNKIYVYRTYVYMSELCVFLYPCSSVPSYQHPHPHPHPHPLPPSSQGRSSSTLSLEFRTPMGSSRGTYVCIPVTMYVQYASKKPVRTCTKSTVAAVHITLMRALSAHRTVCIQPSVYKERRAAKA